MKRPASVAVMVAAAALGFGAARPTLAAGQPSPPSFPYRHLWTDASGVSHIARCEMRHFDLQSMSKPAAPQWQDKDTGPGHVVMTVQPSGWNGAWHEDPKPQWIVPLRGAWFVTAQDGTRAVMGPGELLLGEDQQTKPDRSGHLGHLSGNVGHGAVQLMVVQLDSAPVLNQPCRFK